MHVRYMHLAFSNLPTRLFLRKWICDDEMGTTAGIRETWIRPNVLSIISFHRRKTCSSQIRHQRH